MATFIEGMKCPLCGKGMKSSDRLFGTSHFLRPEHDLQRFSDAAMHWDCYAEWEHRKRFGRLYFEARRAWQEHNPKWGVALSDEEVVVSVNPAKLVALIDVTLAETGSCIRVAMADWKDWLDGEGRGDCRHDVERSAVRSVLPRLRSVLPSAEAVVDGAGMQPKPETDSSGADDLVTRISYQFACQDLAARAARKGLSCPACGNNSREYDYFDCSQVSESGPQSHLTCRSCGKRFGPLDM